MKSMRRIAHEKAEPSMVDADPHKPTLRCMGWYLRQGATLL